MEKKTCIHHKYGSFPILLLMAFDLLNRRVYGLIGLLAQRAGCNDRVEMIEQFDSMQCAIIQQIFSPSYV